MVQGEDKKKFKTRPLGIFGMCKAGHPSIGLSVRANIYCNIIFLSDQQGCGRRGGEKSSFVCCAQIAFPPPPSSFFMFFPLNAGKMISFLLTCYVFL